MVMVMAAAVVVMVVAAADPIKPLHFDSLLIATLQSPLCVVQLQVYNSTHSNFLSLSFVAWELQVQRYDAFLHYPTIIILQRDIILLLDKNNLWLRKLSKENSVSENWDEKWKRGDILLSLSSFPLDLSHHNNKTWQIEHEANITTSCSFLADKIQIRIYKKKSP